MRPLGDSGLSWMGTVLECSLGPYPCLKGNGLLTVTFVKLEDVINHVVIRIMRVGDI